MGDISIKKTQLTQQKVQQLLANNLINFEVDEEFNIISLILKKEKHLRTHIEGELIIKAFKGFKFFQDLLPEMGMGQVQGLFKELVQENFIKRQTVFNAGDIGKNFYIIIKGSVWVLLRKKGINGEDQLKNTNRNSMSSLQLKVYKKEQSYRQLKIRNSKESSGLIFQDPLGLNKDDVKELQIYDQYDDGEFLQLKFEEFNQVGLLTVGMSFGEIALTKHTPRVATIVCREETHFVILSRDTFNKFLADYYEIQQLKNVRFLSGVSIFSQWNDQMLVQLYYHFVIKEYRMNQIVFKEGDLTSHVYLIFEGEIEIQKKVQIQHSRLTENQTILKNFSKAGLQSYIKEKRVRTSIIIKGQFFGTEEILASQDKRSSFAICVSEKAKVYMLERDRFNAYCNKGVTQLQLQLLMENESNAVSYEQPQFLKVKVKANDSEEKVTESNTQAETHRSSVTNLQFPQLSQTNTQFMILAKRPNIKSLAIHLKEKEDMNALQWLIQNKTHQSPVIEKFSRNFDDMSKIVQNTKSLSVENPYFQIHDTKMLPTTSQNTTTDRLNKPRNNLIKSLKLSNVLSHIVSPHSSKYDSLHSERTIYTQKKIFASAAKRTMQKTEHDEPNIRRAMSDY